MRFHPFVFTRNAPRKGTRAVPAKLDEAMPLKTIKYSEQRDEETGYGYFGARYAFDSDVANLLETNTNLA